MYQLPNYLSSFAEFAKHQLVKINPKFYRPAEVELLWGDSTKARQELNWSPKTDFKGLVKKMIYNDINTA